VFLAARAQYWLDRRPAARVLFTCYNASLASHLRNVFALRGLPPDGERLTVRHYHDLCGHILGRNDIHERPESFYATLEPKLLQELARRDDVPSFDCILVDEGQDFTRRMMEVLVRLAAPGGEITVVCDPAQDIYGRWSEDNLAPFRSHETERLVDCYRNTAPIFALALAVLPPETRAAMGLERLELTKPQDLGRDGPAPELVSLDGLDALVALIHEVAEGFDREGRDLSDLAVLYPGREAIPNFPGRLRHANWQAARDPRFLAEPETADAEADPSRGTLTPDDDRDGGAAAARPHFAEALEAELLARNIPVEWVARDFASKAAYDISRSRLTLSTIHSAKGMDFHTVILLGAESLSTRAGRDRERAAALLFTGVTRARERLVLPYFLDQGWVPEIRERLATIDEDTRT
jgi:superfamily I DNA/RNA helicase